MYKYNPDTYNKKTMEELFLGAEEFLDLQVKYRESLERLFKSFYNFSFVDSLFKKNNIEPISDKDYNFYHKYSTLGSNYLFLRNNFHIERLNEEELNVLKECILNDTFLPNEFIMKTTSRVLFEEEENAYFNYVVPECFVPSKGFVFEFAYNELKFTHLSQIKTTNAIVEQILKDLQAIFADKLTVPVIGIVYTANPDLFKRDEIENHIIM